MIVFPENNDFLFKRIAHGRTYLEYNYDLIHQYQNSEMLSRLKKTISLLKEISPNLEVANRSRESLPSYILRIRLDSEVLSIWISFILPYYVLFDPFRGTAYTRPGKLIGLLDEIEKCLKYTWIGYTCADISDLNKASEIPIRYMAKESTIAELLFGTRLGDL